MRSGDWTARSELPWRAPCLTTRSSHAADGESGLPAPIPPDLLLMSPWTHAAVPCVAARLDTAGPPSIEQPARGAPPVLTRPRAVNDAEPPPAGYMYPPFAAVAVNGSAWGTMSSMSSINSRAAIHRGEQHSALRALCLVWPSPAEGRGIAIIPCRATDTVLRLAATTGALPSTLPECDSAAIRWEEYSALRACCPVWP